MRKIFENYLTVKKCKNFQIEFIEIKSFKLMKNSIKNVFNLS